MIFFLNVNNPQTHILEFYVKLFHITLLVDMKLIIGSKIGLQCNEMNHDSITTEVSALPVSCIPELNQVMVRMNNSYPVQLM